MDEHSLHHDDFFAWTREQADVLRGMRGNPGLPNALDLENVIDEVESMGSEVRSAVESYIRLILLHLIKVSAAASDVPAAHWRSEIASFQSGLLGRYAPSLRQVVDLQTAWRRAVKEARLALEEHGDELPSKIDPTCPVPLDDFLTDDFPFDEALVAVRRALDQENSPTRR